MTHSLVIDTIKSINIDEHRCPIIEADSLRENSQFLHQMLPYDPATKTAKAMLFGLNEYRFLLNSALEAIHHFEMGNLVKFDSLVGENACQIRAVWLALIVSKNKINVSQFRQRILDSLATLEKTLEPKKISTLMYSLAPLSEILSRENLTVPLTPEEVFLIQSFLLTASKQKPADSDVTMTIKNVTCPNKLKQFGDVSSNFAMNFIAKLQVSLSLASVKFVRESAKASQDVLTQKMVSDEFVELHHNRTCIPIFWTYKSLLNLMQEEKIPIILHAKTLKKNENGHYSIAKEMSLYFGHEEADRWIKIPPSEIDNDLPAIVFQGIVLDEALTEEEWKRSMESYSVCDILLAAAADHRQYPKPELDQLIEALNNKEYQHYKTLAEQGGFSLENASQFFIQHVYSAKPKALSFLQESVQVNIV